MHARTRCLLLPLSPRTLMPLMQQAPSPAFD